MRRAAVASRLARGHRPRAARVWKQGAAGALAVIGLAGPAVAQGRINPVDRAIIVMPPVYPAAGRGLVRLPETRALPLPPVRIPADPVLGGAGSGPGAAPGDRPVWQPARLDAVAGVDARGWLTSILEYTPGRFER